MRQQPHSKQEHRAKKRRQSIAAHPRRLAHETMLSIAPPSNVRTANIESGSTVSE